jgi:hypothetical protein
MPNVPSDLSLLAFGAEGAQAASVPKMPKAQGLGRLARSRFWFRGPLHIGVTLVLLKDASRTLEAAALGHDGVIRSLHHCFVAEC